MQSGDDNNASPSLTIIINDWTPQCGHGYPEISVRIRRILFQQ